MGWYNFFELTLSVGKFKVEEIGSAVVLRKQPESIIKWAKTFIFSGRIPFLTGVSDR